MFFKARDDVLAKPVGEELILYDSTDEAVHTLNITAQKIWDLCDGSHTVEDIAKLIQESFEGTEYTQVYEDVKVTLALLETKGLVIPKESSEPL